MMEHKRSHVYLMPLPYSYDISSSVLSSSSSANMNEWTLFLPRRLYHTWYMLVPTRYQWFRTTWRVVRFDTPHPPQGYITCIQLLNRYEQMNIQAIPEFELTLNSSSFPFIDVFYEISVCPFNFNDNETITTNFHLLYLRTALTE